MTTSKVNNSLYVYLQGAISNALPLEYAIRSAELTNAEGLTKLRTVDDQIRKIWRDLGARDSEIEAEDLMSFAWDILQVGFPLVRRHGRGFTADMLALIQRGFDEIPRLVSLDLEDIDIPASRYFRICDLLAGNDLQKLMSAVARCLQRSSKFTKKDAIPLEEFRITVREPIHLHPGIQYVQDSNRLGGANFGLLLDLRTSFTLDVLSRHVQEFLYQYAVYRESIFPGVETSRLSKDVIQAFLERDVRGELSDNKIERLDGFASVLTGLYCWDERHRHGMSLTGAVDATLQAYPQEFREVGVEAIKKNYRRAVEEISKVQKTISASLPPSD